MLAFPCDVMLQRKVLMAYPVRAGNRQMLWIIIGIVDVK
jgi:hypothetical protein